MKSGPLAELTRWGFRPINNAFSGELLGGAAKVPLAFIGTVGGYDVEASYTWDNEGYLIVRVFFEPVNRDYDAVMHAWHTQRLSVKKWKFGKGLFNPVMLFSAPVYVDASIPYGDSLPEVKASKLISLAEQIVQGLQEIGRLPINYFDASELANNIIQESKSRNEIRKLKR